MDVHCNMDIVVNFNYNVMDMNAAAYDVYSEYHKLQNMI